MKLTPKQQQALDWVSTTDERYRIAKMNARNELKKLVDERISEFEVARRTAVAQAWHEGVPKSRIGREGLHTTSPNLVYEILEEHEEQVGALGVELAVRPADKFSWGFVHMVVSTNQFLAWVEVDGEEFESEIAGFKHPGYAVLAQTGAAGKTAYSITEGDEPTHSNKTPGKYPELIEWIQANPLEPTKAEED